MAAFPRGAFGPGMFACSFARTLQAPLQTSVSLTPFLVGLRQQRWISTSHVLCAQAAQKKPSPELKEAMERAQRSIKKLDNQSFKWTGTQKKRDTTSMRKILPKPREFDLIGSSEAFYMNSKTNQKSLRDLLPGHDTLPQTPAVESKPPSKLSQAISSIRENIPFFGVRNKAAREEPESHTEFADANVITLYRAHNTRASTVTIAILFVLAVAFLTGFLNVVSANLTMDYQPGSRPMSNRYIDWIKLLQGFGVAFLIPCVFFSYKSRVGLVNRVRFFPRRSMDHFKPWMRAKMAGRSKMKAANAVEGTIEVTSRTWMPFGERSQSFDANELWVREDISIQRLKWENEHGSLENLRAGETASGRKMGLLRKFMVEVRDVVFRTRLVKLFGPSSSFRRAFTKSSQYWQLDLKQFDEETEKAFSMAVQQKSKS